MKIVSLRHDGFLSQKIVCFQGQWLARADIIKYVAHVGHGVHSGEPKEAAHELVRRIRYVATIKLADMPIINFNPQAIQVGEKPIQIDRDALDFVLIQLVSAARYLTTSPDVIRLAKKSRSEFCALLGKLERAPDNLKYQCLRLILFVMSDTHQPRQRSCPS